MTISFVADEILITTGYVGKHSQTEQNNYLNNTELISVEKDRSIVTTPTNCKLPDYPLTLQGAKGIFLSESKTSMICGGGKYYRDTATNKCYRFQTSSLSWEEVSNLNIERRSHAITSIGETIVTCGGREPYHTEIASCEMMKGHNGQWMMIQPLPIKLADHCMVTINPSTILVIGGDGYGGSGVRKESQKD